MIAIKAFGVSQWYYVIDGFVSADSYRTYWQAEEASRKPQHFSHHKNVVHPAHDWFHLWGWF